MSTNPTTSLTVKFPETSSTSQDAEWCVVEQDGREQRVRFHDYAAIYDVPGLYEEIFHECLECASPEEVVGLLAEQIEAAGVDPSSLSALDVGAGNGLVGEQLSRLGIDHIVGVDIIPEAAMAAERDRPDVYADYAVCDLTALDQGKRARIASRPLNAMTTVAALGFDDIPPLAFASAYDLLEDGAWVAFNIKADFVADDDQSGFRHLIADMLENGALEERARREYVHRLSMTREPLMYVALVGVKKGSARAVLGA